ncbi:MAG: ATP-binding protein [Candidatus Aenigmatarchaeota archaeon]
MKEIGTVISSLQDPNSSEFSFVINEDKEKIPVKKNEYIQLKTEQGLLIARVAEIFRMNRYFMRAESVREYERGGSNLREIFPADRWEFLVASALPLGIFENGKQFRVSFPPSPGEKVYKADEKLLSEFLGLDENGLAIGKMEAHEVEVKLNLTKLFQKHLAILAISGAGKSYLASVLIEEILDRKNKIKPAIIVFDPHGEYIGFSEDENYATKTKVYGKNKISIATNKISVNLMNELIPQISSVQRRELSPIIKKLQEEKKVYDFDDLIETIEKSEINPKTKTALISWISELNLTGLFSKVDSPYLEEIAKLGQLTVFDLSDFVHLKERQIILTYFARKLFDLRRQGRVPPFILFVEESHQFCPEGEEASSAISRNIIEQIAREGRKFGACLVLITQRPIRLATTALSQCNTHIIMRINNPYDIRHIGESSEGVTKDVLDMLPGLKVGEALIVGEAVNYPILLRVRERRSKKSEKGMKLEDAIEKFKEMEEIKESDLEVFKK